MVLVSDVIFWKLTTQNEGKAKCLLNVRKKNKKQWVQLLR